MRATRAVALSAYGSMAHVRAEDAGDSIVTRAVGLSPVLVQGLISCGSQCCPEKCKNGQAGQATWED
ncbi:hypothetical protein M271_00020 [Streptomyces rapamycinicus NRRL 5491]|nr:hypothetical protein M271_00020 [Streptomyces rapamycinicus NRRL 5491]